MRLSFLLLTEIFPPSRRIFGLGLKSSHYYHNTGGSYSVHATHSTLADGYRQDH